MNVKYIKFKYNNDGQGILCYCETKFHFFVYEVTSSSYMYSHLHSNWDVQNAMNAFHEAFIATFKLFYYSFFKNQ